MNVSLNENECTIVNSVSPGGRVWENKMPDRAVHNIKAVWKKALDRGFKYDLTNNNLIYDYKILINNVFCGVPNTNTWIVSFPEVNIEFQPHRQVL